MKAEHLEVLVEEPSMEAFLLELLPKILHGRATFMIHTHQGKGDLIRKLGARLRGYATWLPASMRIVVLVDRDDDDCIALKKQMEQAAKAAGLLTRATSGRAQWRVVNRLAIEELEAWFFGEWIGVRTAYPWAYPVDSGLSRCSMLSDRIGAVARADIDGEGAVARGIPEVVSR